MLDIGFWRDTVEATTFYEKQVESGLLPENWTVIYRGVPDGIFIALPLEVPVRRLVSTYLEPTTLSSLLAFALLLLVLVPDLACAVGAADLCAGVVAVAAIALGIAVVATLSRGGMVTFLAGTQRSCSASRWLRSPRPLARDPAAAAPAAARGLMAWASRSRRSMTYRLGRASATCCPHAPCPGFRTEPAAARRAPRLPVDTAAPLEEIGVHPPGSTAEGASKHLRGLTSGLEEMVERPARPRSRRDRKLERDTRRRQREHAWRASRRKRACWASSCMSASSPPSSRALSSPRGDADGDAADLPLALAGAMFGLFVVSWVSESASGLLGNAFYLLFAGWALSLASPAIQTAACFVRLPKLPTAPKTTCLTHQPLLPTLRPSGPPAAVPAKGSIFARISTARLHRHPQLERPRRYSGVSAEPPAASTTRTTASSWLTTAPRATRRRRYDASSATPSTSSRAQTNLGFAGGANVGIRFALENGADYVLLLNNDTIVDPGFLSALVAGSGGAKRRRQRYARSRTTTTNQTSSTRPAAA